MMMIDASILSAFLVGLSGGVHCVGMCGGLVAAFSLQLSEKLSLSRRRWLISVYNLGRLSSYTVAGSIVGALGSGVIQLGDFTHSRLIMLILASFMMLALGLYLAGWWTGLRHLEALGGRVWRRIQPVGKRLLPVTSTRNAYLLGLLWGWLPCGLVYSVLTLSLASGGAWQGGLLMLSFGLGTLPILLGLGFSSEGLRSVLQHPLARRLAGLVVMAYGVYGLVAAWRLWS